MPLATVLIPTYQHCDTLLRSIASVQGQTEQDFELFVVGDGAPPRTDEIMQTLCAQDARIRYFPHPKGEGNGEKHRHAALQQAQGEIVCYLGDDDLWLPEHLATLATLLQQVDFAHTTQMDVYPNGHINGWAGDLNLRSVRQRLLMMQWNFFGPSCVGHRLAAYQQLPHGWQPSPPDAFSDLHMWRQWLNQEGIRFHSEPSPTMLRFPSPSRPNWEMERRCAEMDAWLPRISEPGFQASLQKILLRDWQQRVERTDDFQSNAGLFAQQKEYSRAHLYYLRAIEAETQSVGFLAHWEYSEFLQQQDRIPEAINVLQAALALHPEVALLWIYQGTLMRQQGHLDSAEERHRTAIQLEPNEAQAHFQLAIDLQQQQRMPEALSAALTAQALESPQIEVRTQVERLIQSLSQSTDEHDLLAGTSV